MPTGTVKFNATKGYGFRSPEPGRDVLQARMIKRRARNAQVDSICFTRNQLARRACATPGDRHARPAQQLPWRLVHAHHREGRIVRAPIDIENLLHGSGEVGVALRGDHPSDALPRFEFVFLSTRRTVSCDTESM